MGNAVSDVVSDMALSLDGTDVDLNTSVAMSVGPGATSVAKWRAYPPWRHCGSEHIGTDVGKTRSDIGSDMESAPPTSLATSLSAQVRHSFHAHHIGSDVAGRGNDIGTDVDGAFNSAELASENCFWILVWSMWGVPDPVGGVGKPIW